jgi:chromosome segregation ATPase
LAAERLEEHLMPLDDAGTSARAELAAINRELETATANRDEAQRQVDRLGRPAANLDKAIADLTVVRAAYDARISAWYADGCAPGPRPDEPTGLAALEQAVRQLTGDGAASRPAAEAAQSVLDEQNARLGPLAAQKTSATYRSAAEAAKEYLERECRPAMVESLRRLSAVESLVRELNRLGVRAPMALSAARQIEQQLFVTRSSLAVRGDMAAAKAFLAELAGNPMAEIPAPQHAEIVHVDPPVIKPAEDGTKYLNRGPVEEPPEPTFDTSFGSQPSWAFAPPAGNAGLIG